MSNVPRTSLWTATWLFGFVALFVIVPMVALAQATAVNPDDLGALAKLFLDAIRGGDWQVAVLAGLVVLVSGARKLGTTIPKLGAFLSTDLGGALLTIGTVLPVALLGAHLAGQPLTFSLAVQALGGASLAFVVLRKILRPLVALIPGVGPKLAALVDVLSGATAKAEIARSRCA